MNVLMRILVDFDLELAEWRLTKAVDKPLPFTVSCREVCLQASLQSRGSFPARSAARGCASLAKVMWEKKPKPKPNQYSIWSLFTQITQRAAGSFLLGLRGPAELGAAAVTVTVEPNVPLGWWHRDGEFGQGMFFEVTRLNLQVSALSGARTTC